MTTSLRVKQGDSWNLAVGWYEPLPGSPRKPDTANPIDLTGYTAKLQVRATPGAPGPALLALTSSPAAGLTVDGPAGTVTAHASPAQTSVLPPGVCYWEVEVANGTDTYTLAGGTLTVEPQVVV